MILLLGNIYMECSSMEVIVSFKNSSFSYGFRIYLFIYFLKLRAESRYKINASSLEYFLIKSK